MVKNLTIGILCACVSWAETCEARFTKSGNAMVGTSYESVVTIPSLSVADAIKQMHGVAAQKKLDILTEDAANGTMLLEDRLSMKHKAIPYVVSVAAEGDSAVVRLLVKLNRGAIAKTDAAKTEICGLLAMVKGGEEGRIAASAGAAATSTDGPRKVDAFVLSMELARQTQESAESIPLRYKGRAFTVSGRVQYVIKDGNGYRVAYDIPEARDRVLKLSSEPAFKIDISCLMAPSQSAWSLALRPGEKIRLTGTYSDYDQFKKVMWLENCKPE